MLATKLQTCEPHEQNSASTLNQKSDQIFCCRLFCTCLSHLNQQLHNVPRIKHCKTETVSLLLKKSSCVADGVEPLLWMDEQEVNDPTTMWRDVHWEESGEANPPQVCCCKVGPAIHQHVPAQHHAKQMASVHNKGPLVHCADNSCTFLPEPELLKSSCSQHPKLYFLWKQGTTQLTRRGLKYLWTSAEDSTSQKPFDCLERLCCIIHHPFCHGQCY